MIRIFLILIIVAVFTWFISQERSLKIQAWTKIAGTMLLVFAIYAILFPETTNRLAHHVGVGRGADLMLYILTLAFIASQVAQYRHRLEQSHKLTLVVRKLAILEAKQRLEQPPK